MIKDWKLKLRYGKITTPYKHFTLIIPILIENYLQDFDAAPGAAYMGIKIWATDENQAMEIIEDIAEENGFAITGGISIYVTDADRAPEEDPYAYGANFSYYKE